MKATGVHGPPHPAGDGPKPGPRRSGLRQDRSRRTRQRLVRAALDLWAERGFETGVEQTTVEEIARAAGVTKGTFYFHFARKEDILLEMGWESAEVVIEEARRCLVRDRSVDESLSRVIAVLVRHIRSAPPAAVGRAAAEFHRSPPEPPLDVGRPSFVAAFEAICRRAVERGELDAAADPGELGQVFSAVVMDAILDHVGGHAELGSALRRRCAVVLAGVRRPGSA